MHFARNLNPVTYLVYDGACGTGGMLTVAEETLVKLAAENGREVSVRLYGQEVNPETFAISKADLILQANKLRWEIRRERRQEERAFYRRFSRKFNIAWPKGFASMSKEMRQKYEAEYAISVAKYHTEYHPRLRVLYLERRNKIQHRYHLVRILSAITPIGAASFSSMDLARTGLIQQARLEAALDTYHNYFAMFIRDKSTQHNPDLSEFTWFDFDYHETLAECLGRIKFDVLVLALLAALGICGAYVSILKYDVR